MCVRIGAASCAAIELAEAQVAVGHGRAHPELIRQIHGLSVTGLGIADVGGITLCGDLAQEAKRVRFVPGFPLFARNFGLVSK